MLKQWRLESRRSKGPAEHSTALDIVDNADPDSRQLRYLNTDTMGQILCKTILFRIQKPNVSPISLK